MKHTPGSFKSRVVYINNVDFADKKQSCFVILIIIGSKVNDREGKDQLHQASAGTQLVPHGYNCYQSVHIKRVNSLPT